MSQPPGLRQSLTAELGVRILLVDDQPANLLSLRTHFKSVDWKLVDAASEEEAVRHLESAEFAVILLGAHVFDRDVFGAVKRIRREARARHTPIIFLAGRDFELPQFGEGSSLGAIDFLVEPFLPVVLMSKVAGYVDLFEQKQQAKREADQFRLLVEGVQDYAIFLLNPHGRVASWNPGAERIKQYRAAEIVGQHFSRFYTPEAIKRGWPAHELTVAQQEGRFEDEGWRVRKDGSQFWANVVITALHDETGTLRGFAKITRDITERKRAEEMARNLLCEEAAHRLAEETTRIFQEQQEWLRVTLTSIGDAIIATDTEGRVTFLNPVAEELTRWSPADAPGQPLENVFAIVSEQTRDPVGSPFERVLRDDAIVKFGNRTILMAKDGTERYIYFSAAPIRDAAAKMIGVVLIFRDVSELRQAEVALRESEEKLRLLADTIPQLAWMARPDGYIFWYNRRWYEYTGATPEQMEGWGWMSVHDPEVLPKVMERWEACIASGEPFDMVFPLKGADHTFRPFLTRVNPLRDRAGRILYWFGTNTDISEQVAAEAALRQSEGQQRFLSEVSAALVGSLHYQSILTQVADLTVPMLGDFCFLDVLTDDERLERVGWKHVDPAQNDLSEQVRAFVPDKDLENHPIPKAIRTGSPQFVPDVTDEWLQSIATSPEHLELLRHLQLSSMVTVPMIVGTRPLGALTFCYSVSGRRYTPDELRLVEEIARRAALMMENAKLYDALSETDRRKDEFLATLAHELRNPLAPIRNSLQILKMPRIDAATAQHTLEIMERQVHHLVRLVDDLLDVSRVMRGKIELRREFVDLASVIARGVESVQPLLEARGHELSIALPNETLLLHADPVRLAQVVGNLLTNAAKYTEPNGQISVTAIRDETDVVLRIRDNKRIVAAPLTLDSTTIS